MRKVNLLLVLFAMLSLCTQAQTFYLHAEYRNDWYGTGNLMNADVAGYPSVTLQAQSSNDQYVIEADNGYNRWKKYGTTIVNTPAPFVFYPDAQTTGIGDNYLDVLSTTGHYYTTRLKNTGYVSNNAVVMETTGAPTDIAGATQTPIATAVPANDAVTVSVTLSSTKNPEELFFVRYTNNAWTTSAALPVTFSNATSGTATIPAQLGNVTVSYYIVSSTIDLSSFTPTSDYDLATLRFNNNGGLNYSYTSIAPVVTAPITFRVNMNGTTVGSGVFLAGSFNSFSATANPMTQVGTTGVYEATVNIDTTATASYKFVNGTAYESVSSFCGVSDGFGGYNRSIVVPNAATTLATVCYNLCDNSCQPVIVATAPITFRVNMSTSTVSSGVFLAGSFNGFSASANPMIQVGTTGVYEATVNIDTTATVTYKFVNGTAYESVSSVCGVSDGFGGFNRSLVVPNTATTLATVCYSSCSNCPVPVLVATTFRVNMSGTTIGLGGVHIAGTFNGFSRTANAMTQVGSTSVYEATLQLDTTATHYYKFLNDTSNTAWETIPAACGFTYSTVLNRKFDVPSIATTLPTVCYSLCDNSCNPVVITTAPITFRVNLITSTIGSGVFLAGSFNGFSATANPMTQVGTTGVYEATVNIDTTATITYKFVNGTTYESVSSSCGVSDGFGGFNRSLVVPNVATTLPTVCINSCSDCIVPVLVPITFYLNMAGTTVGAGGVHIAGTFNNFSRTATPMTEIQTNIYKVVIDLDTNLTHYYKFLKDTTNTGWETVPAACGQVYQTLLNRQIVVPETAFGLPMVCFGACDNNCVPVIVPTASITFRVNMTTTTLGAGVFLAGSFNSFSATANPMLQIGATGVYETTIDLDTTATITYKFVNGTTFETVPTSCGVNDGIGNYNRSLIVPNITTILPTVCFNSCSNCPVPVLVATTFRVNMAATTIGSGGVHIAGTFNGFNRTANAMTQVGTTGVYETTIQLDTTATHYYKFLKDTSNTGWETIPAACGFTYSTVLNRQIIVPNTATTLPTVCYNECANCSTVAVVEVDNQNAVVYPNPTSGSINITNSKGASAFIYDINGRELKQIILLNNMESIELSDISKGVYFVKLVSKNQNKVFRIIKEE